MICAECKREVAEGTQTCPDCAAAVFSLACAQAHAPERFQSGLLTGEQEPECAPTREGPAAPKSQRRALAIAGALVTVGVALGVLAAVILVGGLAHSASARQLTKKPRHLMESTWLTENQLQPGDCLIGTNLGLGTYRTWPEIVALVPCTQPHLAEVFYVGWPWRALPAKYPGDNAIFNMEYQRCSTAFRAYDGVDDSASIFAYHSVGPTPASDWATGDREVVCMAYVPGYLPLHSIKGIRQ